jgi:hypothetical protein
MTDLARIVEIATLERDEVTPSRIGDSRRGANQIQHAGWGKEAREPIIPVTVFRATPSSMRNTILACE